MKPIIDSILQTDLYKLTMQWAVIQKFPNAKVNYQFINRDGRKFTEEMSQDIHQQIHKMRYIVLDDKEKEFLRNKCSFLPAAYLDFLAGYRYDPNEVEVTLTEDDQLNIFISGYWYRTILWEVPLMAIVSEVYNRYSNRIVPLEMNNFSTRTLKKGQALKNLSYADFGTRRRYSEQAQRTAIRSLSYNNLMGTSNIKFAMDFNLKPIGTQAHEWYMAHGALYGYKAATEMALENWVDVYQGSLGIALTDTYTSDVFFKSFGRKYAKLFDGVRHDSGDPIKFIDKTIEHYQSLGIDPKDKTIVFSDALDIIKIRKIQWYCGDSIKTSYGIGTYFTNDFPDVKPLNIVIKLRSIDGNECIKLSDDKGKITGNKEEAELCAKTLGVCNDC
jgi:nicotinate phosphoribosyltransferase